MANPSDLEIVRGAVFDVTFTLFEDAGETQPTPLTGKRAVLQMSERGTVYLKVDSAADPTDVIALGDTDGTVTVHLNRSRTSRLLSDCDYYLVIVDLADPDEVEPVLNSRVHVTALPVEI